MNREELMRQATEYGFAAFEWNLYLDTHPNDQLALTMHRQMADHANRLREQYEAAYGPLTAPASRSTTTWDWINDPWPWE